MLFRSFRFIFCSDKPDDKFNPTKGEYNPSKGGEDFSKMTFNISQSYSFVRQFNAKDETKESVAFAEGKLVIDENKIIFTGKDTKGNSYNIAYEGNYTNIIDTIFCFIMTASSCSFWPRWVRKKRTRR